MLGLGGFVTDDVEEVGEGGGVRLMVGDGEVVWRGGSVIASATSIG
jgi:hypothetical protein